MKLKFILCLWVTALSGPVARSQGIFKTLSGTLIANFEVNQNLITLQSKDVFVLLDYNKALFTIRVPFHSFHTGLDTLEDLILKHKNENLILTGSLAIDRVNTDTHPPLNFPIDLKINHGGREYNFSGTGHLEHIEGSLYAACLLGLSFKIDAGSELIPISYRRAIQKPVNIQLVQGVLKE